MRLDVDLRSRRYLEALRAQVGSGLDLLPCCRVVDILVRRTNFLNFLGALLQNEAVFRSHAMECEELGKTRSAM